MAADPYKYFRIEAQELLAHLNRGALDLERESGTTELVPQLLRYAHTLKGAARVVKEKEIADHAHSIEDQLNPYRHSSVPVPHPTVDLVLQLLDKIAARTRDLGQAPAADKKSAEPVVESHETLKILTTDTEELDAIIDGVAEAATQAASLRREMAKLERIRRLAEVLNDQFQLRRTGSNLTPNISVKTRTMLAELLSLAEKVEQSFSTRIDPVSRELGSVRDGVERLRLLPIGALFNTLQRTVRDAAQSLGKRVKFEASGGKIRLEANLLSTIQPALVQAVRNAVAHGIESQNERTAKGKGIEGTVSIEIERQGNHVVFRCRDDGRGFDIHAVRQAVQRKGIPSLNVNSENVDDLLRVLLQGGISTAQSVTELSGRGIGLDIVREAADKLGGIVNLHTETDRETTIEISVPASLSSLDALLVEVASQIVAIPLESVRSTLRLDPKDLAKTADSPSVLFEDEVIPFAPLAPALTHQKNQFDARRRCSAIVVHHKNAKVAIGVDRLLGTKNIVAQRLPATVSADGLIAGASLDAEGNPQLLLDPQELVALALSPDAKTRRADDKLLPILVIDDSLTTRMLEQTILESAGFEVQTATSAEEGLEKAKHADYSLFLVDVEMPGMDGFSFVERVRADNRLRGVPAIMVTSRCAPEDLARGAAAGANAYVVKSEFDQGTLLSHIRRLVRPS